MADLNLSEDILTEETKEIDSCDIPLINTNADIVIPSAVRESVINNNRNDVKELTIINEQIESGTVDTNIKCRRSGDAVKQILNTCPICNFRAVKKRNASVLKCHGGCNRLIQYHCSRLPPYMLFVFSKGSKKYICEICADVPVTFLKNIINEDVDAVDDINKKSEGITKENRYEELEHKVN